MGLKKTPEPVVTKTGETVIYNYCRKCMNSLPSKDFYECVDGGFVDANGLMSVCKDCIQEMYDTLFAENQSLEKSIHKMCTSLNVLFSNEAISATRAHINTITESGKKVSAVFGIYKQKILSTQKTMNKSGIEDMSYEDVGTIFTEKEVITPAISIPQSVIDFWGDDIARADVLYLEREYGNFKKTHETDSYAKIVLLKEVCYIMLHIKQLRAVGDDIDDSLKQLQTLMKNLAISPGATKGDASKESETFGLWIQDIEQFEPAQWLKTDPKGDMYRDVANVDAYFQKYFVRATKNFILASKDFNIEDEKDEDIFELEAGEEVNYRLEDIDDGEV